MAGMDDFVLCNADDVLVFTQSSTVEYHIADLEKVFQQLEKNGIKIKASKLKLGLKIMPFLGVVITRNGMIPDKEKTGAIDNTELSYQSQRTAQCTRHVRLLQKVHRQVQ